MRLISLVVQVPRMDTSADHEQVSLWGSMGFGWSANGSTEQVCYRVLIHL